MKVEIDGDRKPQVVLNESNGRISPSERWVAVTSSTTGSDEIKPIAADGDGNPRQLVVVQNWFEELRRLAPLK